MFQGKRISVALATYNGAKYLKEQLLSLLQQTVIPDEIVISDDASSDKTLEVIAEILDLPEASKINFNILTLKSNVGFCKNFENALKNTTGDYIFLCDQDDIWLPQKIENTMKVFCKYPEAGCVFTNAYNYFGGEAHGETIFNNMYDIFNLTPDENQVAKVEPEHVFECAINLGVANGMVTAITRKNLEYSLPFPRCCFFHDKWIHFVSLCLNNSYYLDEKLALYRIHNNNVVGNGLFYGNIFLKIIRIFKRFILRIKKKPPFKGYVCEANDYLVFLKNNCCSPYFAEQILKNKISFYEQLCEISSKGVFAPFLLFRFYLKNKQYHSRGIKSIICDLLGLIFGR